MDIKKVRHIKHESEKAQDVNSDMIYNSCSSNTKESEEKVTDSLRCKILRIDALHLNTAT